MYLCVFVCERRMFYNMLLQITFSTPPPPTRMTCWWRTTAQNTHARMQYKRRTTSFHTHVWHNYTHFLCCQIPNKPVTILAVGRPHTDAHSHTNTHTPANGNSAETCSTTSSFRSDGIFHPEAFLRNTQSNRKKSQSMPAKLSKRNVHCATRSLGSHVYMYCVLA